MSSITRATMVVAHSFTEPKRVEKDETVNPITGFDT